MLKFDKLTKANMKALQPGESLMEHGIRYTKLKNGDGIYRVDLSVDGRRVHKSLGRESEGVTRTSCEEYIEQARTDARHKRLNLPNNRKVAMGFKEAAEKYLQRQKEIGDKDRNRRPRTENHLIPFFSGKPLDQITDFDVERYKKHRTDKGASKGSVNRELSVLSHLYNCAMEWGWVNSRPKTKRFKEEKTKITYLTAEDCKALLDVAIKKDHPHIHKFIKIGLSTGMRETEILRIKLKDIHIEDRYIYIPEAKAGADIQPITAELADFLSWVMEDMKGETWLFPCKKSTTGHVTDLWKTFKACVKEAGLDDKLVTQHTMRHTAITHLVQAGVPVTTVKKISRHKTLSMVDRYAQQNATDIKEAMDKLQNQLQGHKAEVIVLDEVREA